MIDLTPAQATPRIETPFAARESRALDFKRMGENKVVKKLLETVCTFANTERRCANDVHRIGARAAARSADEGGLVHQSQQWERAGYGVRFL